MNHNVTVVIRSSGERTEKACYDIVRKQLSSNNIFIIKEKPFSLAVKRNFEIGIKEDRKFTLALDADILLRDNAVEDMIDRMENLSNDYFMYQGCVYDKFYGDFRAGGPHLYRTSLLREAIKYIPVDGSNLRPESATYIEMKKKGFHYYCDNIYYGLHDFGQFKIDIYRKFFLHAKKHKVLVHNFLDKWKKNIIDDEDYIIALRGLSDGLLYNGKVYINVDFFNEKSRFLFDILNVKEKVKKFTLNEVDEKIFDINIKLQNNLIKKGIIDSKQKRTKKNLKFRLKKLLKKVLKIN